MTNTYRLVTLKDVFDKVPADRIIDCMRELGILLSQSANMRNLICAMAESENIDIDPAEAMRMPYEIVWIDDGKVELTLSIRTSEDEEVLSLGTKLNDDLGRR